MITKVELVRLYETLLSIPGMNDPVRLDLKIPRKNVLLLSQVIRRGLQANGDSTEGTLLGLIAPTALQDVERLAGELIEKAGLSEMQQKLEALNQGE